jgi:hypothetical protein
MCCEDFHANRAISACNNGSRYTGLLCPLQLARIAHEVKRLWGIGVLRNCWLDYTTKGQEVQYYATSQ